MNTFWCDEDDCEYYSFSKHGLDTHCSLMHNSIGGRKENLAGPSQVQSNKSEDRIKNYFGEKLKVDRRTTCI